ncbi:MAG TPA: hypothetical protein VGW57_13610 [Chthoniobacterales bacterium]|nr:hypothetical protein [Chthoniobacterales bacterium]
MSDYLTRILERSRGLTPHLEPLIAPLHAAPEQLAVDNAESNENVQSNWSPNGPGATEPVVENDAAPRKNLAPASPAASFMADEHEAGRVSHAASEPQRSIDSIDDKASPANSTSEQRHDKSLSPIHHAEVSRSVESQQSRKHPAEAEEPRLVSIVPAREPAAPPNGDRRPAAVEPQINEVRVRRAAPLFSRAPSLSEQAPPAIHVTIGRVEVRAVSAPVPVTKPAPSAAPKKISLDEYLAQRQGRKS